MTCRKGANHPPRRARSEAIATQCDIRMQRSHRTKALTVKGKRLSSTSRNVQMIALPRVMGALHCFSMFDRRFAALAVEPSAIGVTPRKAGNKSKKRSSGARLERISPTRAPAEGHAQGHAKVTIWERSHGSIDFPPTLPRRFGSAPGGVVRATFCRSGVAFVQVSGHVPRPVHEDAPSHIT